MSSTFAGLQFKTDNFPDCCSIIAKVRTFTDETVHIPAQESTVAYSKDNNFLDDFSLSLYANGDSSENEGYISIFITSRSLVCNSFCQNFVFICLISVIDIDNEERFTRSSTCHCEYFRYVSFEINKYLTRNSLLQESSDLLPNNCLTIQVHITFQNMTPYSDPKAFINLLSSVKLEESNDSICKLNLDSDVGEHLYELSSFFKNMMDYTSEKTMEISLPLKEFQPFMYLCLIILGSESVSFSSLETLCQVHRLADKYDIPSALETCRQLIKLYCNLRTKNETFDEFATEEAQIMLEVADISEDEYLKEIRNNFLQRNHAFFEEREAEWNCEIIEFENTEGLKLNFTFRFIRKDYQEKFSFYS